MKSAIKPITPEEYIANLPEPRRSDIVALDKLISQTLPDLKREMGYGIGYGPYHYKYASGREGDTHLISLASNKNYISLYVLAAKDGKYLAETYKDRLGKVSAGKSCIRFKKLADINQNVLLELLQQVPKAFKSTDFTIE
jgi:hypothetical protein